MIKKNYSSAFSRLLVDMLEYGASIQSYHNSNPVILVNADLTSAQQAMGTTPDYQLTTQRPQSYNYFGTPNEVSNPTVRFKGYQAYVTDSITLSFMISVDQASMDNVKMVFSYYSKSAGATVEKVIPASQFLRSTYNGETVYWVDLDSIVAQDARSEITAQAYAGDQPISYSRVFSVEMYMASVIDSNSSDADLVTMVHKLMNYCVSAENYFAEERG